MKYVHFVNLKAYKDDLQQVAILLLVPFSMLQARIMCIISKMDDSLHPKNYERGMFKVAKFPNTTSKLIHQMWDEMVTMIVIKKDNRMVIIFKAMQIDIEGSLVIRAPKKQKRRRQWRRERRR